MSSITQAKIELAELQQKMKAMEADITQSRNLLVDVNSLMSLTGLKDAAAIQKLIVLLLQAKRAYDALMVARLSAGDPSAWFSAGVTVISTSVNIVDYAGSYG